jgi:hypothetical protein
MGSLDEGDDVSVRSAERASAVNSHGVLRLAEHDLSDYCTNLYGENETERCWLAYNYFEERKKASEEGCSLEVKDGVVGGVDCQRLDKFEDFIREMVKEGRIASMAKTLATLAGAEMRKSERAAGGDSTSLGSLVSELDDAAPGDATPARDALRAVLAEVFNSHDFNKDGRMDVQEFRAAMRDMGDELSAKTVSTIFSAMDVHGWLTFNEFVQIVEAEEVRAHSRFAKGLRTLAPKSKWWTEMPHDLDMM